MEEQINSTEVQVPVVEAPVEPAPIAKSIKEKKPFKMNGMVIGMVILVVCLVVGLAYYVLKDNGIDLFAGKTTANTTTDETATDTTTTDTETSTTEEESDDTTVCENMDASCTVSVDNKGWNLFSVPTYNLSVEVPTYSTIPEVFGEKYQNVWETWFDSAPIYLSDGEHTYPHWLDNVLGTMFVNFYPQVIPSTAGCDMNCLGEHYIAVNIFSNSANQNLDAVIASYRSGWEAGNVDEDVKPINLKGDIISKWGTNVWDFEYSTPGGTTLGYLLIKNGYIYEVHYTLASNPAESYQIALKVIDSIKFGE